MQSAIIPGAVRVSPSAVCLNPSAAGSTRQSDSVGLKSSLFGGKATVDLGATSRRTAPQVDHNEAGKGSAFQVRATAAPKNSSSKLETLLSGFVKAPARQDEAQSVVYKGVARIAKKRASVGNFVRSDVVDFRAANDDKTLELMGQKIELQFISVDLDSETNKPKFSPPTTVQGWLTNLGDFDLVADEDYYSITLKVPKDFGEPGAFVIRNRHNNEFFLKSLVLEAPDKSQIQFLTLAWVHPHKRYPKDRVFFSSKMYLPTATPAGLQAVREQELEQMRGDGKGKREPWDRIYDYDVYNDIGLPDKGQFRPVLGGSQNLPYPRRIRTGRPMSKADPNSESRLESPVDLPYIPSDEFFLRTKNSTFIASSLKGIFHQVLPAIEGATGNKSFKSFQEIFDLYKDGLPIRVPESLFSSALTPELDGQTGSLVYFSDLFSAKGDNKSVVNFPTPQVVKYHREAWLKDEEFGRQALAGLNPTVIQCMTTYPPKSTLDPTQYGKGSSLTEQHILPYLEGLTVAQAINEKRLFAIDYHDAVLPFVERVNGDTKAGFKCYAPRTIFFLSKGHMNPVAIELSLPPTKKGGDAISTVFTPADASDHRWDLAKVHASAIDSNFHQVITHYTFTHGVMEPFVIASNRQLSKMHPIRTLLQPHFKDTMNINAGARELLIDAGGIIESTFSMGQYSMQVGAAGYGALWRFDRIGLPQSLLSRGMAEPADASHPGSVKLVVEDYPWAKDGLELWDAFNKFVAKYCNIAYNGSDEAVRKDKEIQAWWSEIVNVGHGDLKNASWWPKVDSIASLVDIITTIGWVAGPLHASVNFGQYAYSGFPPNKPSGTRRFIPEKNSTEYAELQKDWEKFFLTTMTSPEQALKVMTVLELLCTHSVDEEYFGTISMSTDWKTNPEVAAAFAEFSSRVATIEDNIKKRNKDSTLSNRTGPANLPYTLLFPSSTTGLTGQGVPYSVSI